MDIMQKIVKIARLKDQIKAIEEILEEDDTLRERVRYVYEEHLKSMKEEYNELTQEIFKFDN